MFGAISTIAEALFTSKVFETVRSHGLSFERKIMSKSQRESGGRKHGFKSDRLMLVASAKMVTGSLFSGILLSLFG